jgi:hypothetical protein
MSDYRLAELAADEGNLIPEARDALHAEIARRRPLLPRTRHLTESASQKEPLDGIKGWLAWYCLGLFSSVYLQIRLAVSLHSDNSSLLLGFLILCFGIAAWDLATGIAIVRRARPALRMIFVQLTVGAFQGAILCGRRGRSVDFFSTIRWRRCGFDCRGFGNHCALRDLAPLFSNFEKSKCHIWLKL